MAFTIRNRSYCQDADFDLNRSAYRTPADKELKVENPPVDSFSKQPAKEQKDAGSAPKAPTLELPESTVKLLKILRQIDEALLVRPAKEFLERSKQKP